MTLTSKLWIYKIVNMYQLILRTLRTVPEGLLYTLSLICAVLIGTAGSVEPVSQPHIENAFSVFFWLHFILCFRVGLSIRNDVSPMSKIGWLIGLSAFCTAIFTYVFGPSTFQFMKFVMMFLYLVILFLYVGWGMSMMGEPILHGPRKPMTLFQKTGYSILILLGCLSIIFNQTTAEHVSGFLKSILGMPVYNRSFAWIVIWYKTRILS